MSTFWGRGNEPHQPPPVPFQLSMRVSVWEQGQPVAQTGTITFDVSGDTVASTLEQGRLRFVLPARASYGWHVVLSGTTIAGRVFSVDVALAPDVDVTLPQAVALVQLPALRVNGQFFETVDGVPYTGISASSFDLFEHHVAGTDYDPVVDELVSIGFTEARVFLAQHGGLGTFDPRPHLDLLPEFCRHVAARGLRMELTIFPDVKRWCPDPAEQRTLLNAVAERVLDHAAYVQLEGMNEGDYLANGADGIVNETLDSRILWSLGSKLQDGGTMRPIKTHGTSHPARGPGKEWVRKVGHGAMEDVAAKLNIPCKANECKRPDEDGYDERHYEDAGANGALLAASYTFHSQEGKASVLMQDNTRRCADAWVRGAKMVPLKYQHGRYTAAHLHDSPLEFKTEWASRVHARIVGNTACCSVPLQSAAWRTVQKNGWRVVSENNSVIRLER